MSLKNAYRCISLKFSWLLNALKPKITDTKIILSSVLAPKIHSKILVHLTFTSGCFGSSEEIIYLLVIYFPFTNYEFHEVRNFVCLVHPYISSA